MSEAIKVVPRQVTPFGCTPSAVGALVCAPRRLSTFLRQIPLRIKASNGSCVVWVTGVLAHPSAGVNQDFREMRVRAVNSKYSQSMTVFSVPRS
jgi:hypothetical protein